MHQWVHVGRGDLILFAPNYAVESLYICRCRFFVCKPNVDSVAFRPFKGVFLNMAIKGTYEKTKTEPPYIQ